ncbi:MAG TPA: glycosyltransferase [Fimbriimonadaceae bacterium]|jgi:glycosyltransferase involved in cell wall biosynthesis
MPRILHIITGLQMGGAETILYRILEKTNGHNNSSMVLSLSEGGIYEEKIKQLGVPVKSLGMKAGLSDIPSGLRKCKQIVTDFKPDVVQTWMYHADFLGGLASKRAGVDNIVWGLHSTIASLKEMKRSTRLIIRGCKAIAPKVPAKIVSVSLAGMEQHIQYGYPREKCLDIPNGFDLSVFKPDSMAKASLHKELGLDANIRIIGSVGRFHPQKDYRNLVGAFGQLQEKNVHLVMVGNGLSKDNAELAEWIEEAGIEARVSLLGLRSDIPKLMAGFDLLVLSSCNIEAFPTVIGESMCCEVPCVATDVGDSARIMGDTGICVPPRDSKALAGAIDKMLALSPEELANRGVKARERIGSNFSLESMIQKYESLYQELANKSSK